jgi:competence protein ComEA
MDPALLRTTATRFHNEGGVEMIRSAFSLIAFAALVAAQPQPVNAQAKDTKPAATKPAAPSAAKAASGAIVNINTASVTELTTLPGIGEKTAARIIEYRQKNGAFKKVEELMNVRGIGEKNFLKLKPQLAVGQAKAEHESQGK